MRNKFNYVKKQFNANKTFKINHTYLIEQFFDYKKIFNEISKVVKKGDYTLGAQVETFERSIAKRMRAKYAISVGNGTDALYLSLKVLNIGKGDEVITPPYSFIATTASIVTAGATPKFVDIKNDYNIDESKIEKSITKKTKAIMPVHWAGKPCEMAKIHKIAKKYNLKIIQDSSHAIDTIYRGNSIVKYGDLCTFSMHPLKNLNVWGDGGFILTNNQKLYKTLYLLRNHGLKDRNNCEFFGYNSRLDTIQAAVANFKLKKKLNNITNQRINNAYLFDKLLKKNKDIILVPRDKKIKEVFHLYHINVRRKRDSLLKFLKSKNIDAKVHYPIPIHLQKAARYLKYKKGDFPVSEQLAATSISLPVHEFISKKEIYYVCDMINLFFKKN